MEPTLPLSRSSSTPLSVQSKRENFGNRRIDSSLNLNDDYDVTVKREGEVQVDLQIKIKMHRWLCSVQLVLLPQLLEIYTELYKAYDQNKEDNLLQNAQRIFEEYLANVFNEYQGYQEEVTQIRSQEVKDRLNLTFKEFMNPRLDIQGFTLVQKQLSIMKPKAEDKDKAQPVTGKMRFLEDQSNAVAERKRVFLEKIESQIIEFLTEASSPTEDNTDYVDYRKYFYTKEYKKTDDTTATSELNEKAKSACFKYIQFYNNSTNKSEIIYAIDQFNGNMGLQDLEKLQTADFKDPYKHCIKSFDKNELKKIIESLKTHIKAYENTKIEMEEELQSLAETSSKNQTELRYIEEYSVYRKKRLEASKAGNIECTDAYDACRRGNLNDVEHHIEKKIKDGKFDINKPHRVTGLTLLHYAVDRGRPEIVRYLLVVKKASQVVFTSKISGLIPCKYTPLQMAGAICCPEIMILCLQDFTNYSFFWPTNFPISKEWINQPTETEEGGESYTALHFAIKPNLMFKNPTDEDKKEWQKNAYIVVKILLESGAIIQVQNLKSAFVLALEEYNEFPSSSEEMIKSTHSTLSSIITYLLKYPLSHQELKKGLKLLMNRKIGSTALLQEIMKCDYFATGTGQEFLQTQYLTASPQAKEVIRENLKTPPVEIKQSTNTPNTPRNISPGRPHERKHLSDRSKSVSGQSGVSLMHHTNHSVSQISPTQSPQQATETVNGTTQPKRAKPLKERAKTIGSVSSSNQSATPPTNTNSNKSFSPRNSSPRNSLSISPSVQKNNSDTVISSRLRFSSSESLKKVTIAPKSEHIDSSQSKENTEKEG